MTAKNLYSEILRSYLTRFNVIKTPLIAYESNVLPRTHIVLAYHGEIMAIYDYKRMFIFKYHSHEAQAALERFHRARSAVPYHPIYLYKRKDKIVDSQEGKLSNYDEYAKMGFYMHVIMYFVPVINRPC